MITRKEAVINKIIELLKSLDIPKIESNVFRYSDKIKDAERAENLPTNSISIIIPNSAFPKNTVKYQIVGFLRINIMAEKILDEFEENFDDQLPAIFKTERGAFMLVQENDEDRWSGHIVDEEDDVLTYEFRFQVEGNKV